MYFEISESSKPTVVVICANLGKGGSVARVARRQVACFSPSFDVIFVSNYPVTSLTEGLESVTVPLMTFSGLRRFGHVPREIMFALNARKALTEIVRRRRLVTWVICHSHVVAMIIANRVHGLLAAKLALCVHGDVFDRPTEMYGQQLLALYRFAAPRAYVQCDRIYTLSDHGRDLAISAGAPRSAVRVIPNAVDASELGINTSRLAVEQLGDSSNLKLLFVGRLSEEKGLDILLLACALLDRSAIQWTLTVVGGGPKTDSLKELALSLGISGYVCFRGLVPRDELGAIYQAHHLMCMPSRSDPFPVVALEALAAGNILLASPVGALRKLLENGEGVLVEPNNEVTWAKVITKFTELNSTIIDIAKAGQQKVLKKHGWREISECILKDLQGCTG